MESKTVWKDLVTVLRSGGAWNGSSPEQNVPRFSLRCTGMSHWKWVYKARLNRIGGQVSGVKRMIDEDRDYVDIMCQISAARAALGQVGAIIVGQHVQGAVSQVVSCVDEAERYGKSSELMEVLSRYGIIKR